MTAHEDYDAGENGGAMTDSDYYEAIATGEREGTAPGQAATPPLFAEWFRIIYPYASDQTIEETFAGHLEAEREFWTATQAAVTAAAAAQPASGDDRASYERAALIDALVKIRQACKRPEDVAGKTSGSGIVNGRYLAEHVLRIIGALPHITEQPAPAAAPEVAAAMAETRKVQDVLARILSGAVKGSSGWTIRIGQVPLARAWAAAGGPVPDELRRFL